MDVYPLCHGVSFYPLSLSFHLQITYRKVRNLQIGVDKLIGKVSINSLHHVKFIKSAACVISIIINVPAIEVSIQSCILKQN